MINTVIDYFYDFKKRNVRPGDVVWSTASAYDKIKDAHYQSFAVVLAVVQHTRVTDRVVVHVIYDKFWRSQSFTEKSQIVTWNA
jgi:hypothetical protein